MTDHILKASLENNRIITIMYHKDRQITQRNIKVLEIDQDNIKAYCYMRKQIRVFKKDNILSTAFYKPAFINGICHNHAVNA